MDYKCNQLDDITKLSEEMLADAQADDWDKVFSSEERRSSALKTLFEFPFTHKEKEQYSEKIRNIIAINKELEKLTANARESVRDSVRTVNKGHRAVGVYAQHKSL